MPTPDVSIVFPTFQRPADCAKTLELLRRNIHISYEAIILDNSPDISMEKFHFHSNEHYIVMERNLGAASRNHGVKLAAAPFILMLDDDSHPKPGAVEAAVATLAAATPDIAGVTARVEKIDGSREGTPLLPTVFHGCGALFRAEPLKTINHFYPEEFLFYGEEYWATCALRSKKLRLVHSEDFAVVHRFAQENRDKAHILRRLASNNDCVWKTFAPPQWRDEIIADTRRRYQLIANGEGIPHAFDDATPVTPHPDENNHIPIDADEFLNFSLFSSLIDHLGNSLSQSGILLCGAGKSPTFWLRRLLDAGAQDIKIADLNPHIAGHDYGGFHVENQNGAIKLCRGGFTPVVGHASILDAERWDTILIDHGFPPPVNAFSKYPTR